MHSPFNIRALYVALLIVSCTIQTADSNPDYTLTFADGTQKKCPARIVQQFHIVSPEKHTLDFSGTRLSSTAVGILIVCIQKPNQASDLLNAHWLSETINAAQHLLGPEHLTYKELVRAAQSRHDPHCIYLSPCARGLEPLTVTGVCDTPTCKHFGKQCPFEQSIITQQPTHAKKRETTSV